MFISTLTCPGLLLRLDCQAVQQSQPHGLAQMTVERDARFVDRFLDCGNVKLSPELGKNCCPGADIDSLQASLVMCAVSQLACLPVGSN